MSPSSLRAVGCPEQRPAGRGCASSLPGAAPGKVWERARQAPEGDGAGSPSLSPAAVNNRNKPRDSPFPFPTLP